MPSQSPQTPQSAEGLHRGGVLGYKGARRTRLTHFSRYSISPTTGYSAILIESARSRFAGRKGEWFYSLKIIPNRRPKPGTYPGHPFRNAVMGSTPAARRAGTTDARVQPGRAAARP